MNGPPQLVPLPAEKTAQSDQKFAHPRRVLSGVPLRVQHIEHMFTAPTLLLAKPGTGRKSLFNILNKYSILGTISF
jgi:hypothetical protein